MLSDPIRALKTTKCQEAREKYESTYLQNISELLSFGSNKDAYTERIKNVIRKLKEDSYIAAFPFFNQKNALLYELVHITSSFEGFKWYKNFAWKVFGGKSSAKRIADYKQLSLGFFEHENSNIKSNEDCFTICDIADFLCAELAGRKDVPLDEIWRILDIHPIFPGEGFRKEIKKELCTYHNVVKKRTYNSQKDKMQETLSF